MRSRFNIHLDLKKLILCLAVSVTVITFLNGFYSSYQVQKQQLQQQTFRNHKAYAEKLVSATERFLLAAQQQLAFSAKILATQFTNENTLNQETQRLLLQTDSFNSTVVVDKQGVVLDISPSSLKLKGQSLDSDGAQQALDNKKPMISEPYISAAGNLIIFISHPVFNSKGEYLGYIGGSLYLKQTGILHDLLQVHYHQDGSYLYVVDKNRRLLYHPNVTRIGEQVFNNPVIEAVLRGESGAQQVKNSQNIMMLAGFAPLKIAPWGIVTQRSFSATYAPLDGLMMNVLYRTLPIGLATFVFIWVVARLISKPLRQLAETAHTLDKPSTSQQLKQVQSWYFESAELRKAMLKGVGLLHNQIGLLKHEAQTDPLTGLHNRRSLELMIDKLTLHHTPFSVLAIDIDFFKRVNDEFGHDFGDIVLQSLATIIVDVTREHDFVARTGGEEFIVILPNINVKSAYMLAERLRMRVSETTIQPVGCINISIGISGWPLQQLSVEEVLKHADQALYEAKKTGRNRSIIDAKYQDAEFLTLQ
ncbi:sensor domain-containing diguanylate cyclase [Pseudoalteromonas haloplanktis]|uniref:diguanylate cyclase n=1 Tax=Pseudoalteromonas haloplanktis TaxID=228 RepID=A0ABU1B7B7_PSEHA|nr:sensor domain-containing diguanylate cyclase [Pseudoalteromonas haloplanktis]MDQ9090215.1 sensor domain-containing diguanylate cyclase [Pseudoalteromonas haloplanktis]